MSQNTSAINLLESRQPNKIEYQFTGQSTWESVNIVYNVIDHLYFSPRAQNQQYINNFRLYFPSYTIEKDTKFKFSVYFQTEVENNNSYFSSPICPRNTGNEYMTIDDCIIENLDRETYISSINQYPNSNTAYPYTYFPNSSNVTYYSMTITGHRSGDSGSIERILTQGPFFFVYNTNPSSSPLSVDLTLRMYFGRVIFYTEDNSPQDEAAKKELEGTSNIENQTPENTAGSPSENQQTTSIIGAISSFVGAFSNISPSQNCEMDLPFPDFVGGNQRVNICQGKDKAPALITAASSLLLIVTFVPVAFIVLSMIYKEIRSFTNG